MHDTADQHTDKHTDRGRRVLGALLALASVALGVVLILVHLGTPVMVTLAGAGLVVVGLATVTGVDGAGHSGRWTRIAVGLAAVVAGIVVLAWRTASIRTLLWVMVAALVAHGVHTVVGAWRGSADRRVAGLFSGAAAILLGLLCLVWPVLAIELIRYAVGAWLMFVGLRGLIELVVDRPRARMRAGRERVRRWARTAAAVVVFLLVLTLAIGSAVLLRGDDRPEPDAFYTAVEPLPDEPGVLLRAETLTAGVPVDHMGLVAADSPLTPQLVQWTLDRWAGAAPTPTCWPPSGVTHLTFRRRR